MRWQWIPFNELSLTELYAVLRLRQEVFVVEQECPYLDADGDDVVCLHLLGWGADGALDAYLRVYPPGTCRPEIVIGRVITAQRVRRQGWGRRADRWFRSPAPRVPLAELSWQPPCVAAH